MPSTVLELARTLMLKELEAHHRHVRPDLLPEFERRVRMLEREYLRQLKVLLQKFKSRSRVLNDQEARKVDSGHSRQAKERSLKKKKN